MPRAGEEYSGYVLEQTLGRGGSATVYLAHRRNQRLGADTPGFSAQTLVSAESGVALKVLDDDHRGEPDLIRLHREYDLARQVDHPHSVTMHELGPHWLSMQYVDGGDAGTLSEPADRMAALAQIADALDHAHHRGIVHCDVKPANILVHQDFQNKGAVLIDFGVARSLAQDMSIRLSRDHTQRLTLDPAKRITHQLPDRPGLVLASLPYAAPEILLGHMPSAATDEYSLACTAVEMITGTPPFTAKTPTALMDAHLYDAAPRLSRRIPWLPRAFDSILAKAIAKDPEVRYESCAELIELITRTLR